MKRVVISLVIFVVVLIGLAAATPFFISSETVRQRIVAEVEELTGRQITFTGNPTVSFSPFLGIEIDNVILSDPGQIAGGRPLVEVEKLQGKLNFIQAFFGQADISVYRMIRPTFFFHVDGNGQPNWHFERGGLKTAIDQARNSRSASTTAQAETTPAPVEARSISLGRFEIVDGRVTYEDAIAGTLEEIGMLEGSVIWPETDGPFEFIGSAVWRNEKINFNGLAQKPIALLSGDLSTVDINVVSPFLKTRFEGEAGMLADLLLKGQLNLDILDASRLSRLFGMQMGADFSNERVSVRGQLDATPGEYQIKDAAVAIGPNTATGLVQVGFDETDDINIGGTLAFEKINISSFARTIITRMETADQNTKLIDLPEKLQFDLRLSARSIELANSEMTNFAASLAGKGNEWLLDVGTAEVFGGNAIAKIRTNVREGTHRFGFEFSGTDLDAEAVNEIFPSNAFGLKGEMRVNLSVESSAKSSRGLLRNLDGKMDFLVLDGTVNGFDMETLASELDAQSTQRDLIDKSLTTAFSKLSFDLLINRGVGWISSGELESSGHRLVFSGKADFYLGGLAAQAEFNENADEDQLTPAQVIEKMRKPKSRLLIGGSFAAPLLTGLPSANTQENGAVIPLQPSPSEAQNTDGNTGVSN